MRLIPTGPPPSATRCVRGAAAVLPSAVDLLVKSPGVPNESAAVQEALRRGVVLWSEVELAARFTREA